MVRTRQMRRSKGSQEIDTLPLLVVENRKNEETKIKSNRNNSTPNKKDVKVRGSGRKGDQENDTQPLLSSEKRMTDDYKTVASQKGSKTKGSKVAVKLDRQPLRATDHYPTTNYLKMHDMNTSLNKSDSFESTSSHDSTQVYKRIHSADWVEIYNDSKLANGQNRKMNDDNFDNTALKITRNSEIFRRVEAITASEKTTSEVKIKPTNAKTKLSLKDYLLAQDFGTKNAEADMSSVDACLADIQSGDSEESSLFPDNESRDDCPKRNDQNLHKYIGEKVATMLKQDQKEERTDSNPEPAVNITSQTDSNTMEEVMKEEPAVKIESKPDSIKIHTYTDAELIPVEKSNSKCFQSIRVDSLVSICLLDLKNNGTKMSASSRLKHALYTGHLQSKQSDIEKNKRQIILEDIDNEEDFLWSVTITLPVDKSQKRHSFESDKAENAKSHLFSFLQHGELDKACDYLRQKLKDDGREHDVITWVNVAAIELSLGYYGDAVRSFKSTKAMEDNAPREARTLSLLGMALYGDGKFEEANQYYLRALTILRTKEQGYGRYNQYHDLVMGQIFNSVGCSFHERGFHKSSERSFLNALHVYLQDIIGKKVNAEEAQSVDFLLNKVNECKDWASFISSSYLLDTAITFNNLACVLINKQSYLAAISCLRLSLKLQGTGNTVVDQDIMIATLEEVGKSYVAIQNFKDAEHIYNFIFKTNREDFINIQAFHQTKQRASSTMKMIQLEAGKPDVAKKYADLEEYHKNAAIDAVKIEKLCTTLSSTKIKEEGRDDENTIMTLDSIKSSYDLMNADSASE